MTTEPDSQTSQPAQPQATCRLLRSKWMFIGVEPDRAAHGSGGSNCWCVHTQKCVGPDGQGVTPETCKADRACYEPV